MGVSVFHCWPLDRRVWLVWDSGFEVGNEPPFTERVKRTDWRGAVCATPREKRTFQPRPGSGRCTNRETGFPAITYTGGPRPPDDPCSAHRPWHTLPEHILAQTHRHNDQGPRQAHGSSTRQTLARLARVGHPDQSPAHSEHHASRCCGASPRFLTFPSPVDLLLPPRSLQGSADQQHSFPPAWDLPEDPFLSSSLFTRATPRHKSFEVRRRRASGDSPPPSTTEDSHPRRLRPRASIPVRYLGYQDRLKPSVRYSRLYTHSRLTNSTSYLDRAGTPRLRGTL